MPRRKRIVIPGHPHHVTQRGSRRQKVFFQNSDREVYLELLATNARRYGVDIVCYCLMTNHVHLLLVPHEEDSLRWTLQLTHKRFADYVNVQQRWSGHLWQERFYSSPVDEQYFWISVRYIFRNPVEAGITADAVDYRWSSAKALSESCQNHFVSGKSKWNRLLTSRTDWRRWLMTADQPEHISRLRKCTAGDLPCGSDSYLDALEKQIGRGVRPVRRGRPKIDKS